MSSDFISEKKFYDNKNYPHGFSRSGEFTVRESQVLGDYGTRLSRLANKEVEPQNEVEEHFVACVNKTSEAETFIEKTWFKYIKLTTEIKRVYVLAETVTTNALDD